MCVRGDAPFIHTLVQHLQDSSQTRCGLWALLAHAQGWRVAALAPQLSQQPWFCPGPGWQESWEEKDEHETKYRA